MSNEEIIKNVREFSRFLEKQCYTTSNLGLLRVESKFRKLNLDKV